MKKIKRKSIEIAIGGALLLATALLAHFFDIPKPLVIGLYIISYAIIGHDVVRKMIRNLRGGQMLDENFLMCIATVGAFLIGEHLEGVAVMLFYQIGEVFEKLAVQRSRKNITQLMDIRPEFARVKRGETWEEVSPRKAAVGDLIQIHPGERVPLDGVVISGNASLDQSQLTGESMPRDIGVGEAILSGAIDLNGILEVEVTKPYGESTVTKIIAMVERAASRKAKAETFISRFAKYYTPTVVALAAALAIIPSIITRDPATWIYRGLTFLVISCPCALVISIPLSFFAGIGAASKNGILVKGSNYLEQMANAKAIVFDKTGTLTKGHFKVMSVHAADGSEERLLAYAAAAESASPHPIAQSLQQADKGASEYQLVSTNEIAGQGLLSSVRDEAGEKTVAVGNARLMKENGIEAPLVEEPGTVVHVAIDGRYAGYIVIGDEVKEEAKEALANLHKNGVDRMVMLTGDNEVTAKSIATSLGIHEVHAGLLPGDKLDAMESIITDAKEGEKVLFVGDGMNDAPVLARADVGVAMGALGSDAAIESADVVIMDDRLTRLSLGMRIARKTLSIVRENIVFSIGIKVLVLILAALGFANMWWAVFADVGVMVLAVLNAIRILPMKF